MCKKIKTRSSNVSVMYLKYISGYYWHILAACLVINLFKKVLTNTIALISIIDND